MELAAEIKKKRIVFWLFLGFAFALMGQNAENIQKYHQKARTLLLQEEFEKAILQYDSAIHIMPYSAQMHYERAYCKMRIKDYKEAILDFSLVINQAPNMHQARINRGICRYHIDNFYGAKRDFDKVTESIPSHPIVSIYLTIVEDAISRLQQANNLKTHKAIQETQLKVEQSRQIRRKSSENLALDSGIDENYWKSDFLDW
ncbi:MAG: hypothetical protein GY827_10150 [Cytophagales bacterium]|nr:hypothetical protein [Cytophagales bacterium]